MTHSPALVFKSLGAFGRLRDNNLGLSCVVVYSLQRKNSALEAQDLWAEALHGTGE